MQLYRVHLKVFHLKESPTVPLLWWDELFLECCIVPAPHKTAFKQVHTQHATCRSIQLFNHSKENMINTWI